MTAAADVFDEPAFHAAQRARLCDGARRLPLAPPFADALATQLQRYCPDELHLPMGPEAVADCFASVPADKADVLLLAIRNACRSCTVMDEAAAHWATELAVYAALRCLDLPYWTGLRNWQGSDQQADATVDTVPTSSSLIAAIGAAGLQGLAIRVGARGGPDGVIDLTGADLQTQVEETLLIRLYEHLMSGSDDRSRNPYGGLTPDEIGQLRDRFDEYRHDGQFAGLYLKLPWLDHEGFDAVARCLAGLLNTHVILGATDHSAQLVRTTYKITVSSLKSKVDKIFSELPAYRRPWQTEARPPPTASAANSSDAGAVTSPRAAPQPDYRWDVFVSHASEDKVSFVDGLVAGLRVVGLKVWYDSSEMSGGGSVVRSIDEGLRQSRFCVVVLSQHYFAKQWPRAEFEAVLNNDVSLGGERVLPVLFNLKAEEIAPHSLLLASRKVVADAAEGRDSVIVALLALLNAAKTVK